MSVLQASCGRRIICGESLHETPPQRLNMTPTNMTQSIHSAEQREDVVQNRIVGACPANDSPGYRTQTDTHLVHKEHGREQGHDPREQPRTPGTVSMGGTLHPKHKRTEPLRPSTRRQLRIRQYTTRDCGHPRPPVLRYNTARRQMYITNHRTQRSRLRTYNTTQRSLIRNNISLCTYRWRCSSRSHPQVNQWAQTLPVRLLP